MSAVLLACGTVAVIAAWLINVAYHRVLDRYSAALDDYRIALDERWAALDEALEVLVREPRQEPS
jgi:hypothetical protein